MVVVVVLQSPAAPVHSELPLARGIRRPLGWGGSCRWGSWVLRRRVVWREVVVSRMSFPPGGEEGGR